MNKRRLKEAEKKFLKKYPGGFGHPEMEKLANKHKHDQMAALAQESFSKDKFDDPDEIVFCGEGLFRVAPKFQLKDLEKLFRVKVLAMLLRKRKITREFIRMLDGWRHSGFNVFVGGRIQPREKRTLENLAAYLIRATFCQKRMDYSPEQATVLYRSKDGREEKTYPPWNGWPPWPAMSRKGESRPSTQEEDSSQLPPAHWES